MVRRGIPSLTALRAFEAAARELSFRRAADELNVTHSAISHQIKGLERELGVPLFWRRGRQVELTEAGAGLLPTLREAFDRIAEGARQARAAGAAGDLTVQVYVTVAVRWLIPRLHRFQAAHPDIFVRLSTSHRDWDFDAENVDVGIIYARHAGRPDCHYAPLFEMLVCPVCSPALLHEGGLRQPADLADHILLRVDTAEDWSSWLAAAGVPQLAGRAGPLFDSHLLAIEAAIDGQGVAMASDFLVGRDLRSGRLVKPFPMAVRQPGAWYLARRNEHAEDARITRFAAWLRAEIAADPDLAAGAPFHAEARLDALRRH